MKPIEFEVRIGVFVLIGIIILIVIIFSIGDFFFKPGYYLYVILTFANGVQESAPVRLAGVEVGELKEAGVFKDETGQTKVKLHIWVMSEAKVEKDAKVCINTLGLIGEKYVEIIPGTPGSEILKDGDTVIGTDSISVEQITRKGYDVAVKLEKVVDSFDSILSQVKSGKGTVGKLVFDEALYNEVEAMVKDIKNNPWKLLSKPSQPKEKTEDKAGSNKGKF